jgi:hypothetical protein
MPSFFPSKSTSEPTTAALGRRDHRRRADLRGRAVVRRSLARHPKRAHSGRSRAAGDRSGADMYG